MNVVNYRRWKRNPHNKVLWGMVRDIVVLIIVIYVLVSFCRFKVSHPDAETKDYIQNFKSIILYQH